VSTAPSCRSTTPASTAADAAARGRALALPILLACALLPRTAEAAIVEEIVAKVNNRIITKSEFEERSQFILREIYRQYAGAELDQQLTDAQNTMLANMITELLLLEKAETLLDLEKVRVNLVDDFKKQQGITSEEDLERMLKEQQMTRKDLEEQLVRLAVPQEIIGYEVRRKISVSEREVEEHYARHLKDYETPPTVTFRAIVLFYENATRPEGRSRAEGILRELKGGADFADLVQRYSQAESRDAGGLLGPLAAADLQPEIGRAAFAIEPGEVSEPIDTGRAIHVIRVEEKTPRVVKAIAEVRDDIEKAIRQEKFRPLYDRYLKRLWKESVVEVTPKYRRFLVSSPLGAPAAGG
jgi:parvulin-like peptidyl-prolyl isomerase